MTTPPAPAAPTTEPLPREIWVLVGAALVIALGYGLVAPVLPRYAQSFDVGVGAASFIVSIFAIFRLLFAPAGGSLIARFGERPVYLAGLLVVAASSVASAFAQSYGQLLLFRGVGGIGSVMFTVSAMGLIVRLAPPRRRGAASSAYASAFLVGNITGPLVGGLLAGYGLHVPFLVYGVALVLAAALVALLLPGAALRPAPGVPALVPLTVREALGDGAYRAAIVSSFANGWSNFGVRLALVPLFAVGSLGAGDWATGIVLTVYAAGNGLGLALAGRVIDATGRRRPIILGLAVSAAATAALGWSGSVVVLGILSVVAGVGAGLLGPAQQASVADVVGTERSGGPALAAFQMASDLGAITGPVLAGVVADRLGFGWAFALTGLVLAVGAVTWVPQRETLPAR